MRSSHQIPVTVLIAAKNEAMNLPKCLRSLEPAAKVILLDSNSKDGSSKIASKYHAKVIQFKYKGGYPKKRQWALDHLKIATPWVLLIDADEEVPSALWGEIESAIRSDSDVQAYLIKKQFHFMGRKFHFGGFSFEALLLFRRGKARFENLIPEKAGGMDMEVHERLIVKGPIGRLTPPLIHDDFKGLDAYLERHLKYADWEARLRKSFLETGRYGQDSIKADLLGNTQERRRFLKRIAIRVPFEPLLWFLYHFLFRLGFLEGNPGFVASRIRARYIAQVRTNMRKLNDKQASIPR